MGKQFHSPEPWSYRFSAIFDNNGCCVVDWVTDRQDAARIVDCVNACSGMEDPAAEIKALKHAAQQRDELLAALELFCILNKNHYADIAGFIDNAKKVCAKAKGGGNAD